MSKVYFINQPIWWYPPRYAKVTEGRIYTPDDLPESMKELKVTWVERQQTPTHKSGRWLQPNKVYLSKTEANRALDDYIFVNIPQNVNDLIIKNYPLWNT